METEGGWKNRFDEIIEEPKGYYMNSMMVSFTEKIRTFINTELTKARAEGVRETEKAFGGCKYCYGKGYGTETLYSEGAEDFGGDGTSRVRLPKYIPCPKCERGKQIVELVKQAEREHKDV